MKNYVDFAVAAANNQALGAEFHTQLTSGTEAQLAGWFQAQGYDLTAAELQALYAEKDRVNLVSVGFTY